MLIHSEPCWLTIASAHDVNGILLHYMKYHGIQRWPTRTRKRAESKRNSISWGGHLLCAIAYVGIYIVMLSCTSIFLFGFRTRRLRRHAKSVRHQETRTIIVLIDLIVQYEIKHAVTFAAACWSHTKNKINSVVSTPLQPDIIWTVILLSCIEIYRV